MKKKTICYKRRGGLAYAYAGRGDMMLIFINRIALDRYMDSHVGTKILVLDRYKDSKRIAHAITTNLFIPVTITQGLINGG